MSERIFKKSVIYRFSAYFLLLPFLPGIRPVINNYSIGDLIIFISGFVLTIALIIYSNNKPYIRITDNNLYVYLITHHKPEIHYISSIEKIELKSNRIMIIYSKGYDPLEIRLSRKEQLELLAVLEDRDIPVSKADRSL